MLDTSAPAEQQIIPYVDGEPVPFTKPENGTGAGNFANSTLYFMSRGAGSLFGEGDLDEVAVYNRALSAATISEQFNSDSTNRRPVASFTARPASAKPGQQVSFDASASKDPDGTIAKYEWDLDGNGSYETSTGTTPTVNQTYATEGKVVVGLRVTDNEGATGTTTRTISIGQNQSPTASLHRLPQPGCGR